MGWRSDWTGRVLSVLVVLVGGGYALYQLWPDVQHNLNGYSFRETLPQTVAAVGGDARVLSVLDRGGNISFAVLAGDGRVREHYYGEICTRGAKGSSCANRERHGVRPASSRERELAQARIGDIDAGVVDRLRRETGASKDAAVGLRRGRWIVAPPGRAFVADLDGSNLHPAATAQERELAVTVASDSGLR